MLKVAVVGCGKIADGHVEEIGKLRQGRVVAVCDLEPLMAEQLAVRYGIPAFYSDFERLLAIERPGVVHVTTPPQSHLFLARKAIDAGCHVYVEKPLTPTFEQTHELIDYAQAAGRKLTTGWAVNFDPPARALRALVAEGLLGEVVHAESFCGYNLSGAFGAALLRDTNHWVHRLPGKLFQNVINHALNKVVDFLPVDEPQVKALSYRRRPAMGNAVADSLPDELRVTILGGGMSAYATFSAHARPVGHFLRLYGTKNTVHVDYITRTLVFDASPTLPSAIGRLLPAFGQGWRYFREGSRNLGRFLRSNYQFFAGMNYLISAFYDSVINDTAPPIAYRDILVVSWIIDRIIEQTHQETAWA